jgi:flagellar FliL protein
MANENDPGKVTSPRDAETSAPEKTVKPARGGKKLFLLGGLALGAIIIGVAVAVFVINPMRSGSDVGDHSRTGSAAVAGSGADAARHESMSESAKPRKKTDGHGGDTSAIYTIKDIVINPAGTGGTRFLSVSFAFELESVALEQKFEAREPVIRDALITILSSKTVAQLTDPKQKEITRYQIGQRVSELLRTDQLAGVYYTDFVLQ